MAPPSSGVHMERTAACEDKAERWKGASEGDMIRMTNYEELSRRWTGMARGDFRTGTDLIDALHWDYNGGNLRALSEALFFQLIYPVLLLPPCNSWKISSCEATPWERWDIIEHFGVEGGTSRHSGGLFHVTM